jgi:nucleoside 2-deoxyribosyltransferase
MSNSAKIYCAGPIRGDRSYLDEYHQIVALVWRLGYLPLTELTLSETQASEASDMDIYKRDVRWLQEADALIAEVSGPSTGVGYEIAYALHALDIPVLCVRSSSSSSLSAMIVGNRSHRLMVKTYHSEEELEKIVKEFLEILAGVKPAGRNDKP